MVVFQLESDADAEAAFELTASALDGIVGAYRVSGYDDRPERVRLRVLPSDTETFEAGLAGYIEAAWVREWRESERDTAAFVRLANRVEETFEEVAVETAGH